MSLADDVKARSGTRARYGGLGAQGTFNAFAAEHRSSLSSQGCSSRGRKPRMRPSRPA